MPEIKMYRIVEENTKEKTSTGKLFWMTPKPAEKEKQPKKKADKAKSQSPKRRKVTGN